MCPPPLKPPPKKKKKTFCVCVWGERDRERIPMPVLSGLIFLFVCFRGLGRKYNTARDCYCNCSTSCDSGEKIPLTSELLRSDQQNFWPLGVPMEKEWRISGARSPDTDFAEWVAVFSPDSSPQTPGESVKWRRIVRVCGREQQGTCRCSASARWGCR